MFTTGESNIQSSEVADETISREDMKLWRYTTYRWPAIGLFIERQSRRLMDKIPVFRTQANAGIKCMYRGKWRTLKSRIDGKNGSSNGLLYPAKDNDKRDERSWFRQHRRQLVALTAWSRSRRWPTLAIFTPVSRSIRNRIHHLNGKPEFRRPETDCSGHAQDLMVTARRMIENQSPRVYAQTWLWPRAQS